MGARIEEVDEPAEEGRPSLGLRGAWDPKARRRGASDDSLPNESMPDCGRGRNPCAGDGLAAGDVML